MRVRIQEPAEVCETISIPMQLGPELFEEALRKAEAIAGQGAVVQIQIKVTAEAFVAVGRANLPRGSTNPIRELSPETKDAISRHAAGADAPGPPPPPRPTADQYD